MNTFKNSTKMKAVTFSYDDGVTQDIMLINLLNKYGLKCTFNINSELLGGCGILQRNGVPVSHHKIWKKDVKSVYAGHEVAVHTLTHPDLTKTDEDEIIRQVEEDRKNLEEMVGYEIVGMAYPGGGINNDERVAEIIKNSTKIKYARTITSTENSDLQENLYRFNPSFYHLDFDKLMEYGKKFIESKPTEKQILYVWGHSYEMDYDSKNWYKLEEFFKLISGRDDIYYGTNKEVLL